MDSWQRSRCTYNVREFNALKLSGYKCGPLTYPTYLPHHYSHSAHEQGKSVQSRNVSNFRLSISNYSQIRSTRHFITYSSFTVRRKQFLFTFLFFKRTPQPPPTTTHTQKKKGIFLRNQ